MDNKPTINKIGECDGRAIYLDPTMGEENIIVSRKQKNVLPAGYITIDTKAIEEMYRNPPAPETEEERKERMNRPSRYEEIQYLIGGSDDLSIYAEALAQMKKKSDEYYGNA